MSETTQRQIIRKKIDPALSSRPHYMGRAAEDVAAAFLEREGFVVLFRNWRCREGELDIICEKAGTVVICEVKLRARDSAFTTYSAVDHRKQRQLYRVAERFSRECASEIRGRSIRFDVVRMRYEKLEASVIFEIEHIEQALGHAHGSSFFETKDIYRKANKDRKRSARSVS